MDENLVEQAWLALFDEWSGRPAPQLKPSIWKQLISTLHNAPSLDAAAYQFNNRGFREVVDLVRDEVLQAAVQDRRERLRASGWTPEMPWTNRYPSRLAERLGKNAPPLLWMRGYDADGAMPGLAIIGSRTLTAEERQFATAIGRECARLGYQVFSGGAIGADTFGLDGARTGLHFLPGSGTRRHRRLPVACRDPEGVPFDRIEALKRNRWVCAASEAVIVVASRFNRGGSWHTATSALRSSLCPVFAYLSERPSTGNEALVARGARPIRHPEELRELLEAAREVRNPLFQNE